MKKRCLYCYEFLDGSFEDYHPGCSRKFFGKQVAPVLDYSESQMLELGEKVIKSQSAITGVQPKLSLQIERIKSKDIPDRFTIVGLWGGYILKPPSVHYLELPELEDLTMHLAELAGIACVPHSLIRMKSGSFSYITKRVDRLKNKKYHMEDMCQLTERLTEHKYNGSYEQIGKAILKYSINPFLDIINFYEQVIFSFLTGNADMHLKNFSLLERPGLGFSLSPAYDMVASELLIAGDQEEIALTLNGKKRKLRRTDFYESMRRFEIDIKAIDNVFTKFQHALKSWMDMIQISFVSNNLKERYKTLIKNKIEQLEMNG